jgi:hypothetical protein
MKQPASLAAGSPLMLCLGFWLAVAPTKAAELRYPAMGNIRLDQGTVEMWLIPQFDPEAPLTRPYTGHRLFQIQRDEDNRLALMWRAIISTAEGREGKQAAGLYPTGRSGGHNFADFVKIWCFVGENEPGIAARDAASHRPKGTGGPLRWSPGQPKHVAFCWDQERIWWIIDGEIQREGPLLLPLNFELNEDMDLVFGDPNGSRFIFRDLRISSIPREPSEVGYHHPEGAPADFHTLLLDRLDQSVEADGHRQTSPVIMTPGPDGRRGGRIDRRVPTVETKAGPGLAL